MTYLIDHDLTHRLADVLTACGVDAHTVRGEFGAGALDTQWLPQAARKGWVVITADKHIRRRREENIYFATGGLIAVFLPPAIPGETELARMGWFLTRLDAAERLLAKAKPGAKILIPGRGEAKVWSADARNWVKPSEVQS